MKYVNKHLIPIITWIVSTLVGTGFLYLQFLNIEEIPYVSFAPLSSVSVFITWIILLPYLLRSVTIENEEEKGSFSIQMVGTHLFLDFMIWGIALPIIGVVYFMNLSSWIGYIFLYIYTYKFLTNGHNENVWGLIRPVLFSVSVISGAVIYLHQGVKWHSVLNYCSPITKTHGMWSQFQAYPEDIIYTLFHEKPIGEQINQFQTYKIDQEYLQKHRPDLAVIATYFRLNELNDGALYGSASQILKGVMEHENIAFSELTTHILIANPDNESQKLYGKLEGDQYSIYSANIKGAPHPNSVRYLGFCYSLPDYHPDFDANLNAGYEIQKLCSLAYDLGPIKISYHIKIDDLFSYKEVEAFLTETLICDVNM